MQTLHSTRTARAAQPCARLRNRRAVVRVRATADAVGSQTVAGNGTDLAAKKAALPIAIFSSKPYVKKFLMEPLEDAGFTSAKFLSPTLTPSSAWLARDCPVVNLFVNDDCGKEVVEIFQQCGVKLIAMRCAGFDRVDLEACQAAGIQVVRVPTYSPTSVAEHALALLMAVNKRLHQAYGRVVQGNYSVSGLVGRELRGKTVGVMGTGAIGAEACRIFKGIGMNVLAYDIRENPDVVAMGIPYTSIEEILPEADVVSLHVPLLPSTYHFISKDEIKQMKKGVVILNVSRGGLVNSDALIDGLERGVLGGVGMDVYEAEGSLFFKDWTSVDDDVRMANWDRRFKLLLSYPQVLVTPHTAFATNEALDNIANTTIDNIVEWLEEKPLTNEIKPRK